MAEEKIIRERFHILANIHWKGYNDNFRKQFKFTGTFLKIPLVIHFELEYLYTCIY